MPDIEANIIVGAVDKASSVLKGIGGSLTNVGKIAAGVAVGGLAAAAAGVAAIGKASFDAAMTVDEAFDTITTATGATGDELETLKGDFKSVYGNVPADSKDVADVIGVLNQKLDLTGPALQDVATSALQLAQVTGGDAKTAAEDLTRVMGDWGIKGDDASKTLDMMFVASQQSGLGMDQLLGKIDQFGGGLQTMGFSFEESVAMMANWEKQGLTTDKMLAAMNASAGKLSTAHEKAVQEYDKLDTELTKYQEGLLKSGNALDVAKLKLTEMEKNTKTSKSALEAQRNKVEELKKAHDDFAGSIESVNRKMVEGPPKALDFKTAIADTFERIKTAGSETAAVQIAIESFGAKIGPEMAQAIREGKMSIDDMIGSMQDAEGAIANTAAATEDFPEKFERLKNKVTIALAPLGGVIMDGIGTALETLAPIIEKATKWIAEEFAPKVTAAFESVQAFLEENGPAIQAAITTAFETARTIIEGVISFITTTVVPAFKSVVDFITENWPAIRATAEAVFGVVKTIIEGVATFITTVVVPAVQAIAQFITTNWPAIQATAEAVFGAVRVVIETFAAFITEIVIPAVQSVVTFFADNWPAIRATVETVFGGIQTFIEGTLSAIQTVIGLIMAALAGDWQKVWDGLKAGAEAAWGAVTGFLGQLPNQMMEWGRTLLTSLAEGFTQALSKITEALIGVFEGAFNELKKTPFFAFLEKLITGKLEIPKIELPADMGQVGVRPGSILDDILNRAVGGPVMAGMPYIVGERGPELFVPPRSGRIAPSTDSLSAGPVTVNVTLDGALIARKTVDRMTGVISDDSRRYSNGWR